MSSTDSMQAQAQQAVHQACSDEDDVVHVFRIRTEALWQSSSGYRQHTLMHWTKTCRKSG